MNLNKFLLSSIVLFSCSISVQAQETGLSKQYSACMDKSGGGTSSMIACIDAEVKKQDVRLNKAYKQVMEGLTAERKKQLVEIQRNWLKFREQNCKFYADPDGGTMAVVNANDCFLTMTAARAKELEDLSH